MSWRGDLLKAGIDSDGAMIELLAGLKFLRQKLTVSGAIKSGAKVSFVELNHTTKIVATLAAPVKGQFLVIAQLDTGTAGHTVTLTAGTFDGSSTIATFNAEDESLVLFGISATRFIVVANVGSVALS